MSRTLTTELLQKAAVGSLRFPPGAERYSYVLGYITAVLPSDEARDFWAVIETGRTSTCTPGTAEDVGPDGVDRGPRFGG